MIDFFTQEEVDELYENGDLVWVSYTAGYRGGEPCEMVNPEYAPHEMNVLTAFLINDTDDDFDEMF